MKKIFKAYFKLRKGWIIALYALLLLGGLASMVNDSVQWHKWEAAVDKSVTQESYQKFRNYYKENPDIDIRTTTPEDQVFYLNVLSNYVMSVSKKMYGDVRLTGEMFYHILPADYQTIRDELLRYYPSQSHFYSSVDYRNISVVNELTSVRFNEVALMGESVLLIFVGAYILAIILDQLKNITAFIGSRTGGITKINLVQFIYWLAIPIGITSVLSLVTHLTRQFFIPSQYTAVPWLKVLELNINALSFVLIVAIGVSLINALVGKPVYKLITGALAIPALMMAIQNVRHLITYRPISDVMITIPSYVWLLVFALLGLPIVIALQKRHSLEQDSFYIKLDKLRLPFYVMIVIMTIIDFVLPFFRANVTDLPLDMVINLVLLVGIPIVFAKLILNKDVREFFKK
jgi:hypothetical protein